MHFLTSSVNLSAGGGGWPATNPGMHWPNLEPRDCAHDDLCPSHSELSDWAMMNGTEIAEKKRREIILDFDKLVFQGSMVSKTKNLPLFHNLFRHTMNSLIIGQEFVRT